MSISNDGRIGAEARDFRLRRVSNSVPNATRRRVGQRTRGENSSERRQRRDSVQRRQPRSRRRLRTSVRRPSTSAYRDESFLRRVVINSPSFLHNRREPR